MRYTPEDLRTVLDNPDVSLTEPLGRNRFEELVSEQARCGIHPNERSMQRALIDRCHEEAIKRPEFGWIYHTANENSHHQAGVEAGVPDLFWPMMSRARDSMFWYGGMYIELKVKRNKPSAKQLERMTQLVDSGYACLIAWDLNDPIIDMMMLYYGNVWPSRAEIVYLRGG